MHDTAAAFGAAFFRCYADIIEGARILEVGAGDVNGTLRGCAPYNSRYTGIDLAPGPGVDIVLSDPYTYPFERASYDIIVSSSCFEHDQMFWLSFTEMCRVLKDGGFIYLNVPSNGLFHRYPTDNWRFYPDAGLALVAWGRRNGHDIHLVESFIGRRRRDVWNDCVIVFGKGDTAPQVGLLCEIFPRSFNIRVGEQETISNFCERTEDMTLQAWLTDKLRPSPTPNGRGNQATSIETLLGSLAEREAGLGAAERAAAERSAAADAEIAALQGELAAREAAVQRVEEETAGLRAELAEREAGLARADADAAGLRTALSERDAAMEQAERQIHERDAALQQAERQISERDTELTAVRAAVALAAERGNQREAEIDGLRRSLTLLKLEAGKGRANAVSLGEELAAARKVGRSLLAALRTGPALAPRTDRLVGQPQGMFGRVRRWTGRARR